MVVVADGCGAEHNFLDQFFAIYRVFQREANIDIFKRINIAKHRQGNRRTTGYIFNHQFLITRHQCHGLQ